MCAVSGSRLASIRQKRGRGKSSGGVRRGYSGEFRSAPTDHSTWGFWKKAREDCLKPECPLRTPVDDFRGLR
jgi:hypothetical protein